MRVAAWPAGICRKECSPAEFESLVQRNLAASCSFGYADLTALLDFTSRKELTLLQRCSNEGFSANSMHSCTAGCSLTHCWESCNQICCTCRKAMSQRSCGHCCRRLDSVREECACAHVALGVLELAFHVQRLLSVVHRLISQIHSIMIEGSSTHSARALPDQADDVMGCLQQPLLKLQALQTLMHEQLGLQEVHFC